MFCAPDDEMPEQLEFGLGQVKVHNGRHPEYTELLISGEPSGKQGGWGGRAGRRGGCRAAQGPGRLPLREWCERRARLWAGAAPGQLPGCRRPQHAQPLQRPPHLSAAHDRRHRHHTHTRKCSARPPALPAPQATCWRSRR
jgi:hypothetical protein